MELQSQSDHVTAGTEEASGVQDKRTLLIKLVRFVVKCFFQPQDLILLDFILKEKCVSERRLENILRFGPKRLQVALGALKNDKLLGMKTKQGVNSKGNRYRMNYYYIKLQNVASVARYKLYKIGKELKAVECGLSWTKSFHCPVCDNKWSDVDAGELFDRKSMKFQCPTCMQPVLEDVSNTPTAREIIMKFNEMSRPMLHILEEIESPKC